MKREKITVEDVEKVDKLLMDIGEAAEHLKKYEEKLMIHRLRYVNYRKLERVSDHPKVKKLLTSNEIPSRASPPLK